MAEDLCRSVCAASLLYSGSTIEKKGDPMSQSRKAELIRKRRETRPHRPLSRLAKHVWHITFLMICHQLLPRAHPFVVQPPCIGSRGQQQQRSQRINQDGSASTCRSSTQLNGIKGFRGFFSSAFPSSVSDVSHGPVQCDHLLIDVNQFLHTAVRRAKNEKISYINLMKILDDCIRTTKPRKSLVLAMDGPPPAAKLATQRKRRQATLDRIDAQIKLFRRLSKSKKKKSQRVRKLMERKKRKWKDALDTLAITPGTQFMDRAATAILYWVWQRLQRRSGPLHGLKIYVSSSNVPGEGEVKLLEWLNCPSITSINPQDVVVMIGGDSDLVLEGLMVNPSRTANIDVLMPLAAKEYTAVKIRKVIDTLKSDYGLTLEKQNEMAIRTDLVLLLILTGNDYLPKLRGCSGFSHLLQFYAAQSREWRRNDRTSGASILDPETLTFNKEFAMEYFGELSKLYSNRGSGEASQGRRTMTPLARLYNLRDAGLVPRKTKYEVTTMDNTFENDDWSLNGVEDDASDGDDMEDGGDSSLFNGANGAPVKEYVGIKLFLGEPSSDEYCTYEVQVPRYEGVPMKQVVRRARHELAAKALEDFFGPEEDEMEGDQLLEADDDASEFYEPPFEEAVEASVEKYIYGLLWNLKKYQTGVCPDYGFNYGRRLAPTSRDVVDFLELGTMELPKPSQAKAITPGLSCLAALPLSVRNLLPHPYSSLANETIEEMYSSCVDPEDSSFDVAKFASLCGQELGSNETMQWDATPEESPDGRLRPSAAVGHWTLIRKDPKQQSPVKWKAPRLSKSFDDLCSDKYIWASEWVTGKEQRSPLSSSSSQYSSHTNDKVKTLADFAAAPSSVAVNEKLSTSDGYSAVVCLTLMESLRLVDIAWSVESDDASVELVKLVVKLPAFSLFSSLKREVLEYERARVNDGSSKSRRLLKQELAAQALNEVFPKGWTDMTFGGFKDLITTSLKDARREHRPGIEDNENIELDELVSTVTTDGTDAFTCLKQLEDAGVLLSVELSVIESDATNDTESAETIVLSICRADAEEMRLVEKRSYGKTPSRKTVKQTLASRALSCMFGEHWFKKSFHTIKVALKSRI
mmetsp:Transcript_36050/g.74955  ORF Transcript_36050/g.74955 Transcript_36050/m.74955 type:complete len:1090 (-) Transcript_36050:4294-7563(-)